MTELTNERAKFEAWAESHFGCSTHSFNRTPEGYYNAVHSNTFGGRKQAEYAPVSMLWDTWQAARRATPSSECALPPLPKTKHIIEHYRDDGSVKCEDGYTADQVEQIRREAVEAISHELWCAEVNLDGANEHLAEVQAELAGLREAVEADRARNMARIQHLTYERDKAHADLRPYIDGRSAGAASAGEVEYELFEVQGDDILMVAGTSGKRAYEEILHYAAQYVQDGPVEIYKLVRTKLEVPAAAAEPISSGREE